MAAEVSVVVPVRNGAGTIAEQLRALDRQSGPDFDIVVVDNGSTDETLEILAAAGTWLEHDLRIVSAGNRKGPSHARNRGVEATSSRHVLFCDADDLVGPDWVEGHVEALSRNDLSTGPIARLEDAELGPVTVAAPSQYLDQATWAGSGNLGVDRRLFLHSGGFDESLTEAEDIDLCLRLQSAGAKIGWSDKALLGVRERDSLRRLAVQHYRWGLADVAVFVRHRGPTVTGPPLRDQLAMYILLVRLIPGLRSAAGRRRFVWRAAKRAGRIHGSMRHRVVLL